MVGGSGLSLQGCVCSAGQADFGGGVGVPVGTAGVAVLLRMAHQTYLPPAEALFRGCVPRGERRPGGTAARDSHQR